MHCVIYKSSRKDEMYLYVPAREDLDDAAVNEEKGDLSRVPKPLLGQLGKLLFVMELQLTPERPLARANPAEVRESLESRGFYLQMPPSETERLGIRH